MRASRRVQELYLELGHATAALVQLLGRNPTVAELAEATGASEEAVIEAIEAGQGYRAASIDATESEDDPSRRASVSTTATTTRWRTGPCSDRRWPRSRPASSRSCTCASSKASPSPRSPWRSGVSQMHVSRLLSSSLQKLREGIGQTDSGPR